VQGVLPDDGHVPGVPDLCWRCLHEIAVRVLRHDGVRLCQGRRVQGMLLRGPGEMLLRHRHVRLLQAGELRVLQVLLLRRQGKDAARGQHHRADDAAVRLGNADAGSCVHAGAPDAGAPDGVAHADAGAHAVAADADADGRLHDDAGIHAWLHADAAAHADGLDGDDDVCAHPGPHAEH